MAPPGYRIRSLEPGEGSRLLEVERAANALLVATGVHPPGEGPALAAFSRFLVTHDLLVAEAKASGEAVGYAAALDLGDLYWLVELSVDPDHGRQGVGRALLRATIERAGWYFHRAVGLSTYRNVPFNAPFYNGCGFVAVSRQDHSDSMEERFLLELPAGVRPETRVAMVRWL